MTWRKCPWCKKGINPNGGVLYDAPTGKDYHMKCFLEFSMTPEWKAKEKRCLDEMNEHIAKGEVSTGTPVRASPRIAKVKKMSDKEIVQLHDKWFASMPDEMLEKCATRVRRVVTKKTKEAIKKDFEKYGPYWWCIKTGQHFRWGMWIRNRLRRVVTDDKLPDKDDAQRNWDNYYIQVVEYALGLRTRA